MSREKRMKSKLDLRDRVVMEGSPGRYAHMTRNCGHFARISLYFSPFLCLSVSVFVPVSVCLSVCLSLSLPKTF